MIGIWGYTYLKGKNLLKETFTFTTILNDVTELNASSPVYLNGYKVGSVVHIDVNPENVHQMSVSFDVENDYKIPKGTIIELGSDGLIGGKALNIKLEKQCTGSDCAPSGHVFESGTKSILQNYLKPDELKSYASIIGTELEKVIEDVGTEESNGTINQTILELKKTMENTTRLTNQINAILAKSASNLSSTVENMDLITGNLAKSNDQISMMLSNFADVSTQLKNANIGNTINSTTKTIEDAQKVMNNLNTTVADADVAMKNLNEILVEAKSGDGSMAKLINDPSLYESLESTSKNMSLLLQDFRLNPDRYVKVSVFGRKNKQGYIVPEDDPALKGN